MLAPLEVMEKDVIVARNERGADINRGHFDQARAISVSISPDI